VPADDKKAARVLVAAAVVDALKSLRSAFPTLDAQRLRALQKARRALEQEGRGRIKP